jgi:hypothetical protein
MAGAAASEALSPASSTLEGSTGAPLARATIGVGSEGAPAGAATTGTAAAGGAPLPDGGNGSPLRLPPADFAASSFRLGLPEARSSARAKSRAPLALGEGTAALAALSAAA